MEQSLGERPQSSRVCDADSKTRDPGGKREQEKTAEKLFFMIIRHCPADEAETVSRLMKGLRFCVSRAREDTGVTPLSRCTIRTGFIARTAALCAETSACPDVIFCPLTDTSVHFSAKLVSGEGRSAITDETSKVNDDSEISRANASARVGPGPEAALGDGSSSPSTHRAQE